MYTLIMASINYRIVYHTYSNKLKKKFGFLLTYSYLCSPIT